MAQLLCIWSLCGGQWGGTWGEQDGERFLKPEEKNIR